MKGIYDVWHQVRGALFRDAGGAFPADYELVAHVKASSLDEVYQLSNHIDAPWPENPGVVAVASEPRSTSVGDVIVDPDGNPHRVVGVGFKAIWWQRPVPAVA